MTELGRRVFQNFLSTRLHDERRKDIRRALPEIKDSGDAPILSLYAYLTDSPQRFFDRNAYLIYLKWLERERSSKPIRLHACLSDRKAEVERALFQLSEMNLYKWHDDPSKSDDYDTLRFLSQQVHPAYLQLVEGVFMQLAFPIAYLSRLSRATGTSGLDIFQIVCELDRTPLKELALHYHHTIRNGIAHGGTTYFDRETIYRDTGGKEETLSATEMVSLFDHMLDVCNGMALALKVFSIRQLSETRPSPLPTNIHLEELRAETETPWWKIVGCLPSKCLAGEQLLIYARLNTTDKAKVLYSAFHTATLCESLVPGYARYFIRLNSSKALPGFSAFDGSKLKTARERGTEMIKDYTDTLDENLFFFCPRYRLPRFIYKLDNLLNSFRINWPTALRQIRQNLGLPRITVRTASIHRNGWRAVVKASVVIAPDILVDEMFVRRIRHKIIRKVTCEAKSRCRWNEISKYLPIGYAIVSVFERDYRVRRLADYGLGADLIGTVKFNRIRRIKEGDIFGSRVEQIGSYKLAWNQAWLDTRKP